MEQELILKKATKHDIFIENIFYGKDVRFSFPCGEKTFLATINRHGASSSVAIKLTIAGHECSLFLEILPELAIFSNKFFGIDLFSVPQEIRLLVLQTATQPLCDYFSNCLKTVITIDSIEAVSYDSSTGLDFIVKNDKQRITAGTLVAPHEILALFSKKITNTTRLRNLNQLKIAYNVRLGTTLLAQKHYRDLCEKDIIFLDQHELANQKKMGILNLGGISIRGSLASSGFVVNQITGIAQ
ncbi:MAG: hypothetical protein LBH08_00795 [Puniceicoccales bacterium]|jgi:hypothetical protein|nr:hypothetical protein [Puniceicoccales bacterium]